MPTYLEPILYNQFVIIFCYMLLGMYMNSQGMVGQDEQGNTHNPYSMVLAQCIFCLFINSMIMVWML